MIEGSSYYLYYYTGCQSKLIKEDDGFKLNAGIESGYKQNGHRKDARKLLI